MTTTRSEDSALRTIENQTAAPSAFLEFGIENDGTLVIIAHSGTEEELIGSEEAEWPLLTASELELDGFDYTAV